MIQYGGFFERFVAYMIDWFIVSIIYVFIIIPIFDFMGYEIGFNMIVTEEDVLNLLEDTMGFSSIFYLLWLITGWLYFASMESGIRQATLGKLLLNLKVTDMYGDRIGFGRASLRYFGKYISQAILFIGYIMAAFTERRQALHDYIANTVILKR